LPEFTHKIKSLDEILAVSSQISKKEPDYIPTLPAFRSVNPETENNDATRIHNLPIDRIIPFHDHPFKLYEGQRFQDLVESVKENGIMLPIIVRPADKGNYEILSGHNRVKAAKAAGLITVPAIIREGLTDDDALLIVTETNLLQRSFADLSHSERALTLSKHYDAIKKQGRRTDLINDIENMLKAQDTDVSGTFTPVGYKLNSGDMLGEKYGLCRESVARYIRINKLIDDFKDKIDNNEIAIRTGVVLSYLSEKQQEIIDDVLSDGNYKIDLNKAEMLKAACQKKMLTHENAEEILKGGKKRKPAYSAGFKLQPKIVLKYFQPDQKRTEIENTIVKALDYYFARLDTKKTVDIESGLSEDEKPQAL